MGASGRGAPATERKTARKTQAGSGKATEGLAATTTVATSGDQCRPGMYDGGDSGGGGGSRVEECSRPAAAWSGRQGAEGVAMSTTAAVATPPVEVHISMVEAAAVAPGAAENTPECWKRRLPLLSSVSCYIPARIFFLSRTHN